MTIPRPIAFSDEINFRIRSHFDTRGYDFYIGNYKSPPPDTAIVTVTRKSFLYNVALARLIIIERSSRLTRNHESLRAIAQRDSACCDEETAPNFEEQARP